MRKKNLFLFAACALLAVTAPLSLTTQAQEAASVTEEAGNTYVLDSPTGAELQKIFNLTKDGTGEVDVTLTGNIQLTSPLYLYSNTTVHASGASISGSGVLMHLFPNHSNIHIDGGTWTTSTTTDPAVYVNAASHCILENMKITHGTNAIYQNGCTDNVIVNNTVSDTTLYGLQTRSSSNCLVIGNTVSNVTGVGIFTISSQDSKISGNTVYNITPYEPIENKDGVGFESSYSDNIVYGKLVTYNGQSYKGNFVKDTTSHGFISNEGTGLTLYHNQFINSGRNGIHISGSNKVLCQQNTVESPKESGIWVTPGHQHEYNTTLNLYKNVIRSASQSGIYVTHSHSGKIAGNKISNSGEYGIGIAQGCENLYVSGNKISNTRQYGIMVVDARNCKFGQRVTRSGVDYLGNTITSSIEAGIYVHTGAKLSFKNNTINKVTGSGSYGIFLANTTGGQITGNVIKQAKAYPIQLQADSGITIKDNTIYKALKDPISIYSCTSCTLSSTVTLSSIKNQQTTTVAGNNRIIQS